MPSSVNGIGTHYYGKRNIEARPGVCQHCGRSTQLTSYDTRLWFVVFFIPIVPLGRKRIIDYCPACTRHIAINLDKWETAKQLEISGALEKFRSAPTPEAAIEAHQQLLNFHQLAQAADFRKLMAEKFGDNAKVQAYLGAALEHFGRLDEAATHYARALELRPDLPEARVGVADSHIRAGRLDEARKLLDFLEKPGAGQVYPLASLEDLGLAYQKAGRHREALELFARLLSELPRLGEIKGFRKMVGKSEKAAGSKDSILPKLKFSLRRLFSSDGAAAPGSLRLTWRSAAVAAVVVALVALGFIISNEYIRRHRTVHVVNPFNEPATVAVQGFGSIRAPRGVSTLSLPEGRHHAVISGPMRDAFDFEVRGEYFDRWFSDPAWVINVGGRALLLFQDAVYSARNPRPPTLSLHYGTAFLAFPKVTHPFTPLPNSVRLKSHEERTLTHLDVFNGATTDVFQFLEQKERTDEALRLAEWSLKSEPGDQAMLALFTSAARRSRQTRRAENFLRAGLTNRPVVIEWHRAFQNLRRNLARNNDLAAQYDAMLSADPTNSSLAYLRGRLCPDHAECRKWFELARDFDPSNPYPWFALGYDRAGVGDWAAAKLSLTRAVELAPKEENFAQMLFLARLALAEFAPLEQEQRGRLARDPIEFFTAARLVDTLVAQGKSAEADKAVSGFQAAIAVRFGTSAMQAVAALRRHLLYAEGKFDALEKMSASDRSPGARESLVAALIEQGRLAEAVKSSNVAQQDEEDRPVILLSFALAWRQAGNTAEAAQWLARALKALEAGDDDYLRAAALLQRDTPPTQPELDAVILPVHLKPLLLVALAQQHPSARAGLAAAARRLNVNRGFPFHLIQRLTAAAPAIPGSPAQ